MHSGCILAQLPTTVFRGGITVCQFLPYTLNHPATLLFILVSIFIFFALLEL